MMVALDSKNELRNVKVDENGHLIVSIEESSSSREEVVTTLYAGVMTLSAEEQTIGIDKKVTEISIANYSETSDIVLNINGNSITIGSNLAIDLPINKTVSILGLSANEADVKVQYAIKGVE